MHAGMRCNSCRSETLPERPRSLSPEGLNVFSVPLRLNTHLHEQGRPMLTLLKCLASTRSGSWVRIVRGLQHFRTAVFIHHDCFDWLFLALRRQC
jgi:hypothetical protein